MTGVQTCALPIWRDFSEMSPFCEMCQKCRNFSAGAGIFPRGPEFFRGGRNFSAGGQNFPRGSEIFLGTKTFPRWCTFHKSERLIIMLTMGLFYVHLLALSTKKKRVVYDRYILL